MAAAPQAPLGTAGTTSLLQACKFEEAAAAQQNWPVQYSRARVGLSNMLLCLHGITGAGDHVAASSLRVSSHRSAAARPALPQQQ